LSTDASFRVAQFRTDSSLQRNERDGPRRFLVEIVP
jgi:hypothetical protein